MASESAPLVVKTPNVCGGRARIAGHRIPVWVLEEYRRLGMTDARILSGYEITPEQLAAAWEYVAANKAEIDQDLKDQE